MSSGNGDITMAGSSSIADATSSHLPVEMAPPASTSSAGAAKKVASSNANEDDLPAFEEMTSRDYCQCIHKSKWVGRLARSWLNSPCVPP